MIETYERNRKGKRKNIALGTKFPACPAPLDVLYKRVDDAIL